MLKHIVTLFVLTIVVSTAAWAQDNYQKAKEAADKSDFIDAVQYIRPALLKSPKDAKVLALATSIYSGLEVQDSALMYGARMYAEDDDTPEYVRIYALALTQAGQAPKACQILRKIYKKDPSVETSLYLVNALVEADSVQAAELVATTTKKNFPNNADAYFALGILYAKYKPQPVWELAKNNLEKAIELDDSKVLAHFALAEAYWRMANRESDKDLANELFRRSLVEWNKVGQLEPRNARAWFEQGKIFYLSKKYKEALGALERYRDLRPGTSGNPIAVWYMGKSFFELQACDSAKVYLTEAVERIDSLKYEAALMLGKCNILTRQWQDAVTWYRTAYQNRDGSSKWDPTDVWYYGTALVMTGDTATAIPVMTEAALRDPSNCQFMFRFGYLLGGKGLTQMSTRVYQQRLSHCSDSLNGKIYMLLGNNFYQDSVIDSAIVYYEKSLATEPSGYVTNRLAETYAVAGDDAKARALYGQVIAAGQLSTATTADKQQAVQAILKLNGLDLGTKKYNDIVTRCKTGLEIDPKNPWLMLYLAFGYQGSGNTEGACKWYKEVLRIDADNETAKKNLQSLGC